MPYNGWTNYETWNCALHIGNEVNDYEYWRERTREVWEETDSLDEDERSPEARRNLADAIKVWVDENMPDVKGMYGDILMANLSSIDTWEIADHMLDDEDLEGYEPRKVVAAAEA